MKIRHHAPVVYRSDPVTPEYQAEVDRHTSRAAAKYEAAQRRLAQAELRLQHAQSKAALSASKKKTATFDRAVKVAEELVELRREDLLHIEAMMKAVPASIAHRGRGGHRPIPSPGPLV